MGCGGKASGAWSPQRVARGCAQPAGRGLGSEGGLEGRKAERLAETRLVPQNGLVPLLLLRGCGPSCPIKGTPPPASCPDLSFPSSMCLPPPPGFLVPSNRALSPATPQQLSLNSFYSSSAIQLPAFFISPFSLEPILQNAFFSVFHYPRHPSLPVPTCPLLSSFL